MNPHPALRYITGKAEGLIAGAPYRNRGEMIAVVAFWYGLQRGRCWWCAEKMPRPEILRPRTIKAQASPVDRERSRRNNLRDTAATIEHLLRKGDPSRNTLMAVRLAHRRCNNHRQWDAPDVTP